MLFWSFLLRRAHARRLYRETLAALTALDADARADIGVASSEIDRVARDAACRAAARA